MIYIMYVNEKIYILYITSPRLPITRGSLGQTVHPNEPNQVRVSIKEDPKC
jgi:hypothetical protein